MQERTGFTLIELMVVVAILAILAVVAVPAFTLYLRRAKTVEAVDELEKMHKSSAYYYARGRVAAASGAPLACQFPGSIGMTPDVTSGACCAGTMDTDRDDRCDVVASQWDPPAWSALNFQMSDQHYFGFTYISSGELEAARFTARANADLDCDGVLSTFERYGYGSKDSSYSECSMSSASAMYKNLETE